MGWELIGKVYNIQRTIATRKYHRELLHVCCARLASCGGGKIMVSQIKIGAATGENITDQLHLEDHLGIHEVFLGRLGAFLISEHECGY